MARDVKEGEQDLFPNSYTSDEGKGNIDNEEDLNIQLQNPYYIPKNKGGSSSRKYRKQSKTKFKGKNIDTEFQIQRNDPLLNTTKNSNNGATNQTMPMWASSNVTSPIMGNIRMPTNFMIANTTKNSRLPSSYKRPVSAVMGQRLSPHSSIDFPIFDLNKSRPRNIKRDKMSLYDDAIKLK